MNAGVSLGFMIPLILLFLMGGAAILIFLRRSHAIRRCSTRQPCKRHIVTRIICGMLGVAILVAVGFGTWSEAQSGYETGLARTLPSIHLPTREVPALPIPTTDNPRPEVESARLLMHLVVVEGPAEAFRPVYAHEFEIQWPADKGLNFTHSFSLEGIMIDYEYAIESLGAKRETPDNNKPSLMASWTRSLRYERWDGSGSRSGSGTGNTNVQYEGGVGYGIEPLRNPLSTTRGAYVGQLQALLFTSLVSKDDPLREAPVGELISKNASFIRNNLGAEFRENSSARIPSDISSKGVALAMHLGISTLILLAAAALLTELFTHRALAFVGVIAGVVLYTAALDSMVLSTHQRHFEDADASIETRLFACSQIPSTFFYRETARESLARLAADEHAPEVLRNCARREK